mmetsp:Transcript_31481/g.100666  ORF Transcript_31481/g.100666 Transcript_31481/m.100666 type:complete len:240 (+) Transcript_31481:116-835(+)
MPAVELVRALETTLSGGPLVAVRDGAWCCLLCERRFGSERHIARHLSRSKLHRDNYASGLTARRIGEPSAGLKRARDDGPASTHLKPAEPAAAVGIGIGAGGGGGVSAIEQMEMVQQRLAAASKASAKKPARRERERDHHEGEVDSNKARSINGQLDWECSDCGSFNFARVVVCHTCNKHVDGQTRYLNNRLHELKQERFARIFGGGSGGGGQNSNSSVANPDGSVSGGRGGDRAAFQS